MKEFCAAFFREDDGQAILEYILGLTLAIAFVGILAAGFRQSILKLWLTFSKDISAACPGCPADPGVNFR